MTISMSAVALPLIRQMLGSLSDVLAKGEAFAEAKKIDPAVLVSARLAPDMFPLSKQVQIASDMAKGCVARLAGVETPLFDDTEKTFPELKARLAKTLDFVDAINPAHLDGTEAKAIVVPSRSGDLNFTGESYLIGWVIPNMIFHCVTAYDILRHNGVEVGKKDFLGVK